MQSLQRQEGWLYFPLDIAALWLHPKMLDIFKDNGQKMYNLGRAQKLVPNVPISVTLLANAFCFL